jgi:CheY-like chemotaxis protein
MVMETVVTCKDGSRKPIETHASFANGFGIMVLADLTQKKLAETELLNAKQAAEEANQAKSAFLASMSHELRTPLNSIIGFAQMLEMGAVVPLDPSQKEPIGHILGSGRHLLGLINEVLDLARIEAGRMDISLARMTLDSVIEEAVALTRPAAEARHIAVHHDCHTTMVVRADAARVRQILLNLLSNAVKYNRDGGRVDVSCVTEGDRVRIIVADTGTGILEGQRYKLFKPFQRLGAEQTDIEGTGIGLVICKKLAEAMGGDIDFDSEVGIGSRFWMELPLDPTVSDEPAAAGSPATKPAMDADPEARGRVIYIEDNPVNITVMQHVFRRLLGVKLMTAETAEKGLMMVRQAHPDLVLMDINLPGMSGMEALRILKSDPDTLTIPVIAVSAAALPRDIQAGLEAGFLKYCTKPLDVPVFIDTLKWVLKHHIE